MPTPPASSPVATPARASSGKKPAPRKPRATKATTTNPNAVTLSIKAQPGLSVFVAGSFNDWNATSVPLKETDGVYSVTLELAAGLYEYKFVINGVWTLDPNPERDWTQNGLGTLNSVLRVG